MAPYHSSAIGAPIKSSKACEFATMIIRKATGNCSDRGSITPHEIWKYCSAPARPPTTINERRPLAARGQFLQALGTGPWTPDRNPVAGPSKSRKRPIGGKPSIRPLAAGPELWPAPGISQVNELQSLTDMPAVSARRHNAVGRVGKGDKFEIQSEGSTKSETEEIACPLFFFFFEFPCFEFRDFPLPVRGTFPSPGLTLCQYLHKSLTIFFPALKSAGRGGCSQCGTASSGREEEQQRGPIPS